MSVPVLPDPCERGDTGGMPCAGGACPAPGGTPTFLSLAPMAALRRRARLTGRLPHGRLRKPVDPCCNVESAAGHWTESLPWRPSPICSAQPCATRCDRPAPFGCQRIKSQFRSLDRCGCLATRKACRKGDIDLLGCVPCARGFCDLVSLTGFCPPHYGKRDDEHSSCCDCANDADVISEHGVPLWKALKALDSQADSGTGSDDMSVLDDDNTSIESLDAQQLRKMEQRVAGKEKDADCSSSDCDDSYDSESSSASYRVHEPNPCTDCDGRASRTPAQRAAMRRHAFRPNQTLRAVPSGQKKPISENMSGVRYRSRVAPRVRAAQRAERNRPASTTFRGVGDPNQFCLSTTCRFAGSSTGGPVEKRAAICQLR